MGERKYRKENREDVAAMPFFGATDRLCLFFLLAGAAWTDLRRRKIPNLLLVAALAVRMFLLGAEILVFGGFEPGAEFLRAVLESLFLSGVLLLASCLCGGGLGMGDVKLVGTVALFAGGRETAGILFGGLLLAAVFCLLLWGRKRLHRKEKLPLAPFLLGGFLILTLSISGCNSREEIKEEAAASAEQSFEPSETKLCITFFDVGKGDAILLESGEQTMLIDTGFDDTADVILNYLKEEKIETLDYLVITHFDQDHVGGADKVLKALQVGEVLTPDYESDSRQTLEYQAALAERGMTASAVKENRNIVFSGADCTVYPPKKQDYEEEDNDFSLVISVSCKDQKFLFTGDSERERLSELLTEEDFSLEHQVLKVPHHGKKEKNSKEFLEAVNPEAAVITCSKEEEPDRKILKVLERIGTKVYLTSEGTVTCRTDGKTLVFTQ